MPKDRIKKYATDVLDGDESLAFGSSVVRLSIIRLLIDKDDNNRTQQKKLLNPKWNYVACYEVGKVSNMHYWVLDFGQAKQESLPMFDENNVTDNKLTPSNNTDNWTKREQSLLQEVNFLRNNPNAYAVILSNYLPILEEKKNKDILNITQYNAEIEATKFVIKELEKLTPLNTLTPSSALYTVAKKHGVDARKSKSLTHIGSDGSTTWDRLKAGVPNIIDGDQCLVGGTEDIREALTKVLIDHAISNRSRPSILLQPEWTNVAAYEVGTVGNRPFCWVITFGKI
jgi:uncharacterized protein YkwD